MVSASLDSTRELDGELDDSLQEPEASADTEARESPVSPGPSPTTDAGEGPQTGTRRPWWRSIFGE